MWSIDSTNVVHTTKLLTQRTVIEAKRSGEMAKVSRKYPKHVLWMFVDTRTQYDSV